MFVTFKDVNGSQISLSKDAIWAVTLTKEGVSEILLVGGERSIKIDKETYEDILTFLRDA